MRGRYERAQRWFAGATTHAACDDEELSWITGFAGAAHADVGEYPAATGLLDEAVGRAVTSDSSQAAAMAHTWRGRLRLFVDDERGALEDLDRAVEIAENVGWRSFLPWPQTIRAEIAYRRGDLRGAAAILHPALATSLQVGDPCWESLALRGLGLTTLAGGDLAEGLAWLEEAPRQCRRLPDTYLWVEVYALDALADVTSQRGLPDADRWIQRLDEASTSHGMRVLSLNAADYRQR